ncbi:MAG TPA: hypothetical protein VGM06_09185 [Polyangiaceae bacterium]
MNVEDLFARFFLPLYPPDARSTEDLARARVTDANPGKNQFIVAHLDDATQRFTQFGRQTFGADLALDGTDASVHRLSAALTRERRDAWAAQGAEGSAENALFNAVIHGSAYVGSCVVAKHGGTWGVRRPLWESVVRLRSRAGEADLAIFHWWLKSLADDGQGTTLADRYRSHVEVPCARPEELPVLTSAERALPRLAKPRYDTLHKYLRAHLPELRDLGEHFPSPERFDDFALRWIDFHLVGGGRMLLMAAASETGLHLFWLSAAGFEKSAFFVCDAFPDPVVRVRGDRIVALLREGGRERENEMLWWGP